MAVETYGVVQIGGSMTTIGEAEEFIRLARDFGADDSTLLVNGFLSVEYVGVPTPIPGEDGTVRAELTLTPYVGE